MTTSADIANEALVLVGINAPPVTGVAPTFDDSDAGLVLQQIYAPCVAAVGRQFGLDFATCVATLTLSGNVPPLGFSYEYVYPSNGIEVQQVIPATFSDLNDPLPYNWKTGNAVVSGTQTKVIWTDIVSAKAVYNNNPTEGTWDPLFRETVVRVLGSELAIAMAGKPETSQINMEAAGAFGRAAAAHQD